VEDFVNLSAEIFNAAGQPLTARVGKVTSTSPFVVEVQGTPFTDLGLIGSTPSLGATVLLLGQSVKGAKSSGSSWICMGTITAT
jgi:hypothetical protein